MEDWKNYYEVLRVSPNTELTSITAAYKRLKHIYHHALSDNAKKNSFFSEMIDDINEAYRVLSNPVKRARYDRIFWANYCSVETGYVESVKEEILDSVALVAQDVLKRKRGVNWKIPGWGRATRQAVLVAVITLFLILLGGTSLAFAKPGHTVATPFKGIVITVTAASATAVSLIEDIRGIVAIYERNIVSTALQSMTVTEGLKDIPPVTVSTNDMACFPSREFCLFPDYLDKQFCQFKYTIDSHGIVSVDTSSATTDAFLGKIKQLLVRLTE